MLTSPRALLLDFGGVLADAPTPSAAPPPLVEHLSRLVGDAVPVDRIVGDLPRAPARTACGATTSGGPPTRSSWVTPGCGPTS
ncbi:hypothetical protein JD76_06499 [Micromonospora endolithica]|nr:hypothetical protein JD76_06499 [Micromonospora endolithica]